MRWKEFTYFTRSERRGVLVLLGLIILLLICLTYLPNRYQPDSLSAVSDSLYMSLTSTQPAAKQKNLASAIHREILILRQFDPNEADSTLLRQLGLPAWMVRNIIRYREKGGRFRKAVDFKKIYGLTDSMYTVLAPYITIAASPKIITPRDTTKRVWLTAKRDTFPKLEKFQEGTIIDLNQADTSQLKKIPGIGSTIARRIVSYRQKLGGYVAVNQLQEIQLDTTILSKWFMLSTPLTPTLNVNKASIERLKDHPYLNFYQAKVIMEYRRKRGKLKSLSQLKLYEEFTAADLERLAPYICF